MGQRRVGRRVCIRSRKAITGEMLIVVDAAIVVARCGAKKDVNMIRLH